MLLLCIILVPLDEFCSFAKVWDKLNLGWTSHSVRPPLHAQLERQLVDVGNCHRAAGIGISLPSLLIWNMALWNLWQTYVLQDTLLCTRLRHFRQRTSVKLEPLGFWICVSREFRNPLIFTSSTFKDVLIRVYSL